MPSQFKVLPGGLDSDREITHGLRPTEKKLLHFRNVSVSVLQDALDTWGEIWDQLQGTITHGVMIVPEAEKNFEPECGWPQFLEKMWLLRHYLDYARRFCDGKP